MSAHKHEPAEEPRGRKVSEQLRELLASLTAVGGNLDSSGLSETTKADARSFIARTASNLELAAQHVELGEKKGAKKSAADETE